MKTNGTCHVKEALGGTAESQYDEDERDMPRIVKEAPAGTAENQYDDYGKDLFHKRAKGLKVGLGRRRRILLRRGTKRPHLLH